MTRTGLVVVVLLAGCGGGGSGDVDAGLPDAAAPDGVPADATPDAAGDAIVIEIMGAPGAAQLRDAFGEPVATCELVSCTVPVTPGQTQRVVTDGPGPDAQLTGACTGGPSCMLVTTAGVQTVTATFPLDTTAGEEWSIAMPSAVYRAELDSSGNVIIAGGFGVTKLDPSGGAMWSMPIAAADLTTGPGDSIYIHTGTELKKLDGDGGEIWTRPIPTASQGCNGDDFGHCLGTGVTGEAAIRGASAVTRWDTAGTETWTRTVEPYSWNIVTIDGTGVVWTTIEDPDSAESQDAVRFTAGGAPLAIVDDFCAQYWGMLYTLPVIGTAHCTSSGHSNVYGVEALSIDDPDYAPTGIAGTGTGDVGWLHYTSDGTSDAAWRLARYTAGGALVATQLGGLYDDGVVTVGPLPHDLTGGATGRLVVVGSWRSYATELGYVTSYAP